MATELPEARFDEDRAIPCFPRADNIKYALYFCNFDGFAINIRPEWNKPGEEYRPQTFVGDFYIIFDPKTSLTRYGSAKEQWRNMHVQVGPLAWIKVLVPMGYHVEEDCVITTWIIGKDGEIEESRTPITAGTLVIRQPGGEFQFVQPKNEATTYYSEAEARELGLYDLSIEEFGQWAIARAKAIVKATAAA